MITIFTGNNCIHCDRAKKYLRDHDYEYEERNIANDQFAFDDYRAKFPDLNSVPVIVIDDTAIVGFNPATLQEALSAAQG